MKPDPVANATCAFLDASNPGTDAPVEQVDLSFLSPPIDPTEIGWLAHYRVLRELGSGGMGVVLEAVDTHLNRPVALKVMRKELAAQAVTRERFLQEARAAAALNSDHIVTVYQVGLANDVPFLAMQLLRGESLESRLTNARRMTIGEALTIAKQAAMGLADAHAVGLVHRDIKPANLWLESDGTTGSFKRVRILDFGLARRDSGNTRLTATGVVVGTPHYMAPEQASGTSIDGRADIFSLGGVLYTMLTGELAFEGDSVMAVLMALASRDPIPISARCPDVPPAVSDLVARMLNKDPNGRPATASDVVNEIDSLQELYPDLHFAPTKSGAMPALPGVKPVGRPATTAIVTTQTKTDLGSAQHQASGDLRRTWIGATLAGLGFVAVTIGVATMFTTGRDGPAKLPSIGVAAGEPIAVGILHSQSGTMALSESPVIDATIMAIDEINAAGGVLGHPIKPIIADGASEPTRFAELAERMLTKDNAQAIFGCWTSASRKAVKPVVERLNGLLLYPVQYEGLEQSPRIVYLGSAPNQQLLPAIDFLIDKLGKKRIFLIGSDYIYPRAAHAIMRDRIAQRGGAEVVGESFLLLGEKNVASAIEAIQTAKPDAIINTINGSTNVFFFQALRAAGIKSEDVPTISTSVSENMLRSLDVSAMANDYLIATYFQSVVSPESDAFEAKLQHKFGNDRVATDAMASAYSAIHIWAKAAQAAGRPDAEAVIVRVRGQTFASPFGDITVNAENQHISQPCWIGHVRSDGQVHIIGGSAQPIAPEPWPATRTRQVWERFLNNLYVGWDGRWQPSAKN